MQYCYSNNGMSWRGVNDDYVAQTGEVLFPQIATPAQLTSAFSGYAAAVSKASLDQQITALEATMTPRRIREAANGTDNGWMKSLDAQIATLRIQLTTT